MMTNISPQKGQMLPRGSWFDQNDVMVIVFHPIRYIYIPKEIHDSYTPNRFIYIYHIMH